MNRKPDKLAARSNSQNYRDCIEFDDASSCLLAEQLKALGHPARLQIVSRLKELSMPCCGDVCECLPLAQSTVSQHLDVLKRAGLVNVTHKGTRSYYKLNKPALQSAMSSLSQIVSTSENRKATG